MARARLTGLPQRHEPPPIARVVAASAPRAHLDMSLFAACCITDQPEIDGPVSQIASYANAFLGDRAADEFLTYVVKAAGGELSETTWTRGEFWAEAQAAAAALAANGVGKGDRVTHFFSQNDYKDILFRLGASMIGAVPVTVNWEAGPPPSPNSTLTPIGSVFWRANLRAGFGLQTRSSVSCTS